MTFRNPKSYTNLIIQKYLITFNLFRSYDLILKTEEDVGISTVQSETKFEVINDLISIMDMNTIFDFDLVESMMLEMLHLEV